MSWRRSQIQANGKQKNGTRLDGYVRVSEVGGREGASYISPSVQREHIERWAAFKGVEIAEWHVDEDVSGGTQDRPGLTHAIERAVSGQTGGIVAARIDRFSRTTEGGLRDLRRLKDAGARLAFVAEDVDTASAMGAFVYTIMLAMAELYLANIKSGWAEAHRKSIKRGAHNARPPFGYVKAPDNGKLTPDENAPIITEAFERSAASGLHAAQSYLREQTGRKWPLPTVRRVLANRAYLGETRWGDLVQVHTHEPLTNVETFMAAQHGITDRRAPHAKFPLSGLVKCDACGSPLIGTRGGKDQRRAYRCAKHCANGPVPSAEPVEHFIAEWYVKWLGQAVMRVEHQDGASELAAAEAELVKAEERLSRWMSPTMQDSLDADVFERGISERQELVSEARERVGKLRAQQGPKIDTVKLVRVFPTLPAEQRVEILRPFLVHMRVRRGRGPVSERVFMEQADGSVVPLMDTLGGGTIIVVED